MRRLILTMPLLKSISVLTFSLTLISSIYVVVSGDGLNPTILAPADKLEGFASLNSPAAVSNSTVFKVAGDSILTINLLSSLSEDQEISVYCRNLLEIFGQRYAASINCLVPAARPVKICQNCFSAYDNVRDIYMNISSDQVGCDKTSWFSLLAERPPFFRNSSSIRCPLMCLMITGLVMLLTSAVKFREMRINLFDFVSATGCFGICVSTSKPLSASVSILHLPPDGSTQ